MRVHDEQHGIRELLALIAEYQDFWARRAFAATALQHNVEQLQKTIRRLHIKYSMLRKDSRDYVGFVGRKF